MRLSQVCLWQEGPGICWLNRPFASTYVLGPDAKARTGQAEVRLTFLPASNKVHLNLEVDVYGKVGRQM